VPTIKAALFLQQIKHLVDHHFRNAPKVAGYEHRSVFVSVLQHLGFHPQIIKFPLRISLRIVS